MSDILKNKIITPATNFVDEDILDDLLGGDYDDEDETEETGAPKLAETQAPESPVAGKAISFH